jgi:gliding motility-associated-like protein
LCTQAITGQSATVTVTANTTINLTSAATTTSQAVCVNTAITDITYAISGGGTNATVTGLPTGVSGVYNAGVFTISGTPADVSTTPQTFTYTVNATGLCLPSSVTGSITINPDASITLTSAAATTAQEVCKNTAIADITYTIAGGGTGGVVTGTIPIPGVTFTFGPGGSVVVSGTPAVAGNYNYTITTVGSCVQTSTTGTIIVNELPTADFTFSSPNCENKSISFNDASTPNSGNLNNWQWNFGDATTGTGSSITHIYPTAGAYTVNLTVTTDKGCVSNPVSTKIVTVNVNPQAGFEVPEVCINDIAAVFIDTSKILPGNIIAWKWDFGDPGSGALNTSVTKDGTHLYTATGSYLVTHIAFSSTGCSDTIQQSIFINGANPVTDFSVSNPTTLCANDSVSIINLSTVNPGNVTKVEIYWDNAGAPGVFETDDFPALNKVYKHKYLNFQAPLTRTFTIRFRAYSGTLCVSERIRTITVNAAPRVQFNNIPNICMDAAPYQITQASEIGAVPGIGVFSGPGVTAGGLFTPSVAGPGTHNIKYTFTSTTGGCVDTLTKTIHVFEPPVAGFSFTTPVCETKVVTFSDNTLPTEGSLATWTWDFGDGSPLNVRNNNTPFNHIFPAFGTYPVKLTVTTNNGCLSIPKIISVTVNPQPKVNFDIPASVCLPNANVTFNNLSSIADGTEASFNYLWNFGDPGSGSVNTSTGRSPSHTYTGTGPFNINLQVISGAGCIHDTTIILNTIHPQPIAAFSTDKIDVCIGGSITFTDNTNPLDGTTTQWNWILDDGNVRNTPTFTYTYGAEGTYRVGLFVFNNHGCRSTTANTTVFVNPYPSANAGPDKFMLEGGQVMLTPAVPIGINVTYLWSPAATLNNATISNPLASPKDDITYTLTVTSDKGCVARPDQVFVKVLKMPAIPNIFSPNGDGIHDRWGIEYLNTYPGATIDVYNRYGQLVFHSVGYATQWDGKVNGKDVPVGTYYYVIDPKNGRKKLAGYVDVIR